MQGAISPEAAAEVAAALYSMGCYEVSMGDTTGAGTPASIAAMLEATKKLMPVEHIAAHLHDTYGQVRICTCIGDDCVMVLVNTFSIQPA